MSVGVGIDIGSCTSRVVKLERRGSAIRWAGSASAPAGSPDLPARLREARIRAGGGVCGLSGNSTILRYTRVPLVPLWKLKMLVGYEATQGGELDVSFDYRLLNLPAKVESTDLMVLTAVTKNDALVERLADLARRGIRNTDFAPDALAVFQVFSNCPESNESLDQFCLVLDIGATKTEMVITYNGGLIFARPLAFGGNDFTKAIAEAVQVEPESAERLKQKQGEITGEDQIAQRPSAERPVLTALSGAAEQFFGTVRSSLMFARAQTKLVNLEIGRVFLSGAGARIKGLPEFFASKFGVRTSAFTPPDEWQVPRESGPSEWMIALGLALLALDPSEERLSILPAAEHKRRQFWRRNLFAYAACMLFFVTAAVGAVAAVHNWSVARETLRQRTELKTQADLRDKGLAALAQGNTERRARLQLLAAAGGTGARFAEFLDLVKQRQDPSIVLSKLTFQRDDINKLDGQSVAVLDGSVGESAKLNYDILTGFREQLKTSRWYPPDADPSKLIERATKTPDGNTLEFRLRVPLRNIAGDGAGKGKQP
jgi:type IV pilus assembly protein PilM